MTDRPELLNAARDPEILLCGDGVTDHDYRPIADPNGWYPGQPRTYLRCVWCHAVACGNHDDQDPCIEVWHHEPKPHRSRSGERWPIGGTRVTPPEKPAPAAPESQPGEAQR